MMNIFPHFIVPGGAKTVQYKCDDVTELAPHSVLLDCRPSVSPSSSPKINPNVNICGIFKIQTSNLYLKRFEKNIFTISQIIDSFQIFHDVVLEKQATVYFLGIETIHDYAEKIIKDFKNIFPDTPVFSLVSNTHILSFQTVTKPVLKIAYNPSPTSDDSLSEILPNFFLTSLIGVNKTNLEKNGIFNVISVINYDIKFPLEFKHLHFSLADSPEVDISQIFSETFDFIDACLTSNQKIVVHCQAGISRSASVVIAYVMRKQKMTFDTAYKVVKSKRSIINPNFSFCCALKKFEKENQ